MWITLRWPGKDGENPSALPDGRDWEDVLYGYGIAALPDDLWLEPWNHGKRVDWLWSGSGECVVSERFLQVLAEQEVPGVEYRPLTVRRKRSADIEGYYLLHLPEAGPGDAVRRYPSSARTPDMLVDRAVAERIRAERLTGILMTPTAGEREELERRRQEVGRQLRIFRHAEGAATTGEHVSQPGLRASVSGSKGLASSWDKRCIIHASDLVGDVNAMTVELGWRGKDPMRSDLLSDGQDCSQVLFERGVEALPVELWLEVITPGERTDWLWTTGCGQVVSRRFLDLLLAEAVPGIEYRSLLVRSASDTDGNAERPDVAGDSMGEEADSGGYFLLRVYGTAADAPLRLFPPDDPHAHRLDVDAALAEKMRHAGLSGVITTSACEVWDELASEAEWLDQLLRELAAE